MRAFPLVLALGAAAASSALLAASRAHLKLLAVVDPRRPRVLPEPAGKPFHAALPYADARRTEAWTARPRQARQEHVDRRDRCAAKRSQQRHVLPADTTTTLCGINVTKWAEQADVNAATTNCPVCASALKAATAKAAEQHITEPAPVKPSRRRKKAEPAEPQAADVGAESAAAVS